jgi:hypothetical protein
LLGARLALLAYRDDDARAWHRPRLVVVQSDTDWHEAVEKCWIAASMRAARNQIFPLFPGQAYRALLYV